MNLIIDIGNTLTKVAIIDSQRVEYFNSFSELNVQDFENVLKKYQPVRGIVSSVRHGSSEAISWLMSRVSLHFAGTETRLPIANDYATPETLGFDRIAVAVGANFLYPNRNVLVIDAGTAITYELITSEGQYKGGAISPGLGLRYRALNTFTARLPLLEPIQNTELIGKSTVACIHSGVINGAANEMQGFINEISSIYDNCIVVLTGGDANFFANKLKNSIFVNPFLMILGLNRILEFNAQFEK